MNKEFLEKLENDEELNKLYNDYAQNERELKESCELTDIYAYDSTLERKFKHVKIELEYLMDIVYIMINNVDNMIERYNELLKGEEE